MYIRYAAIIGEKGVHGFEREKGEVYGRLWKKERKGEITYFQKISYN